MDSLTQLALGACVGVATLGPRIGPRRAAIVGGVLGTLPDLDVFFPYADPVDAFVLHRAASHSLIVQAAAAPALGEIVRRLFAELRPCRALVWISAYLCLATHALLDALTIYGTRLFWPIWPEPLGAGSVFIIDPLYTAPLLIAAIWALRRRAWTPRLAQGAAAALAISTAYLGWGLVAQQIALDAARSSLARIGVAPARLIATPTPFNSLLWRAIAMDGERYYNLYVPVLAPGRAGAPHAHPSGAGMASCLADVPALRRLAAFSRGFYRIDLADDAAVVSDIRMGLTPNYVFRFAVARRDGDRFLPISPLRLKGERSAPGDLDWLWANLRGVAIARPAEAVPTAAVPAPACPSITARSNPAD